MPDIPTIFQQPLVSPFIAAGFPQQGTAVSLISNGTYLLVGAPGDFAGVGTACLYNRIPDIPGIGYQPTFFVGGLANNVTTSGPAGLGSSVAISSTGGTFVVGAPHNNSDEGAAWVFSYSQTLCSCTYNNVAKLINTDLTVDTTQGLQGTAVSITASGGLAVVGAPGTQVPESLAIINPNILRRDGSTIFYAAKA